MNKNSFKSFKSLCLKNLLCLIFIPWILIFPVLVVKEIQKLHLRKTWKMNDVDRKFYFLKVALPKLKDDYFGFLKSIKPLIDQKNGSYHYHVSKELTYYERLLSRNYAIYELMPLRPAHPETSARYLIYYRMKPEVKDVLSIRSFRMNDESKSYLLEMK